MPLWIELPLGAAGSVLLWIAGTTFFDAVHWLLHRMLRSRWRALRLLAWPHGMHHRFLDDKLQIRWENQRKNIFCHLLPEYLTQLAFSAACALVLPLGLVAGCALLQTAVFVGLLRFQGLDVNHRPVEILDAYRPSILCPPAYHALHHVYPDGYFSAYNKLVDWAVGGGAYLPGRRYGIHGADTPFGRALRAALLRAGAAEVRSAVEAGDAELGSLDVLVLCDPGAPEEALVEDFVRATRTRQLPPEVWAVHEQSQHGLARHYYRDLRVSYRSIVLPCALRLDAAGAARAARIALFFVRRGFHFVPTRLALGQLRDFRRFRNGAPARPAGVARAHSRADLRTA